jgi:hypothetical protein
MSSSKEGKGKKKKRKFINQSRNLISFVAMNISHFQGGPAKPSGPNLFYIPSHFPLRHKGERSIIKDLSRRDM